MRNNSADGSDSTDTKSIIGTPASNLLTINGAVSYLGPQDQHDTHLEPKREPSATPARPTASPLMSVPATPKTKQLPPPHSGPPSASTGTMTALPSPSSKAMPPPKLVVTNLKRKGPGTASLEDEADRPSKKTAPSPKPRRKNAEKARDEAMT